MVSRTLHRPICVYLYSVLEAGGGGGIMSFALDAVVMSYTSRAISENLSEEEYSHWAVR